MASNPLRYYIDNQLLNIKNIINYLFCLSYHKIIPKFMLDTTDDELIITIIYSSSTTSLKLCGSSIITYNIYTKKWKGVINLYSIIDGKMLDRNYINIQRDFPFIVDNNLLKINFQHPYVEYVIESDFIEDVLEPSLNKFIHSAFDPRDLITIPTFHNFIHISPNIREFYDKVDDHERHLLFLSKKALVNKKYFLPEELWINIYKYY